MHLCLALLFRPGPQLNGAASEPCQATSSPRAGARPGPSPLPPPAQAALYPPRPGQRSPQFSLSGGPAQGRGSRGSGLYPLPKQDCLPLIPSIGAPARLPKEEEGKEGKEQQVGRGRWMRCWKRSKGELSRSGVPGKGRKSEKKKAWRWRQGGSKVHQS